MSKTNLQKWIAYMKRTPPGGVPPTFPDPTGGDAGKILIVGSNGKPTWANAVFDADKFLID